jgi:protein phosphatase-4 regulatory subunit 3
LATLAACVKTILLLNDPSIIELIVSDELIFEEVCSTLEYDPDLRDKANHRWFLRERAKFRTVALMEDEELVASIHRSFRVTYLRDTLLRPTMDESSLSTLSSLQTFTHADVVKGVTVSPAGTDEKGDLLKDSYLAKIIRILGREVEAVCDLEWRQLENLPPDGDTESLLREQAREPERDRSTVVVTGKYPQSQKLSRVWKQYLAPQDDSLASRRIRRHGCVTFLRELFNMVRISLQQSDKDDFFAVLVSMEVDLDYEVDKLTAKNQYNESNIGSEPADSNVTLGSEHQRQGSRNQPRTVNLLALLGTILADPKMDITEKGSVLEVVSGIVMHDPGLVRRRCLESFVTSRRERRRVEKYFDPIGPMRPRPNEKRQLLISCPPNDLLGSLMFLLAIETDSGILLQVSEIMRAILDTDMMTDHGPMGVGFTDEAEGIPPGVGHSPPHEHHVNPSGSLATSSDQNQFLSMFYDHYVQWLAAPFQHKILRPICRIPTSVLDAQGDSGTLQKIIERFETGLSHEEPFLRPVTNNAVRSSFVVELLSFCVRAHLYRMKCYLLRSRIMGSVLKVLNKPGVLQSSSGERCLTLAALRYVYN